MVDHLSRIEQDRALFNRQPKDQLAETIATANPQLVAGVISKALELQIITEEIANEQKVHITDELIADYASRNKEYITEQLNLVLTGFIGSIVSQEG